MWLVTIWATWETTFYRSFQHTVIDIDEQVRLVRITSVCFFVYKWTNDKLFFAWWASSKWIKEIRLGFRFPFKTAAFKYKYKYNYNYKYKNKYKYLYTQTQTHTHIPHTHIDEKRY